jgi:hypothetical protein
MFDLEQFKTGVIAETRNGQTVKYVSTYTFTTGLNLYYGVTNNGQVLSYDEDGRIDLLNDNPFDLVNMVQPPKICLYAIYTPDGQTYYIQPDEYKDDNQLMEQFGSPITVVPLSQKMKLSKTLSRGKTD